MESGREEAGEVGRGLTVIGPVCHDEGCRLNLETREKTLSSKAEICHEQMCLLES